jgi:biotin carboxylase
VTLLILNRRRFAEQIPVWLADIDPDLVLITARSVVTGDVLSRCRSLYREIVVVDDYDGAEVDDIIVTAARRHAVDRILSCTETDVLRAARAREALVLPGQGLASAIAYRDKYEMKSLAAAAGLAVTPMCRLHTDDDLLGFVRMHGLPVVVKPSDGGGSVGVRVLSDQRSIDDLIAERAAKPAGPHIVEAYVEGEFYAVNGLMAAGDVLQMWSFWSTPNLSTVAEGRALIQWMLLPGDDLNLRLQTFARAVIRALPAPPDVTAFHAELFHTPADELVLCEIACRPGGNGTVPAYEHEFGVNLYAAMLRGQASGRRSADLRTSPTGLGGWVTFPPRRARLSRLPERCPIEGVYSYTTTGQVGTVHAGAHASADHIAQVLVSGPLDRSLAPTMQLISDWWDAACVWEPAARSTSTGST